MAGWAGERPSEARTPRQSTPCEPFASAARGVSAAGASSHPEANSGGFPGRHQCSKIASKCRLRRLPSGERERCLGGEEPAARLHAARGELAEPARNPSQTRPALSLASAGTPSQVLHRDSRILLQRCRRDPALGSRRREGGTDAGSAHKVCRERSPLKVMLRSFGGRGVGYRRISCRERGREGKSRGKSDVPPSFLRYCPSPPGD